MELMDTQQAAEFLHLKKSYLYKLVHEKKIPHYKPGHHLLFTREDLELYVSRNDEIHYPDSTASALKLF